MRSIKRQDKPDATYAERRQIEAAKTSRLRTLRLAKEAEDRETAAAAAAANPGKPARRRAAAPTRAG